MRGFSIAYFELLSGIERDALGYPTIDTELFVSKLLTVLKMPFKVYNERSGKEVVCDTIEKISCFVQSPNDHVYLIKL